MENSFFEYRDKTPGESESDSEIIDDSFVENITYSTKKKNPTNHTVFVAESEESASGEESDDNMQKLEKPVIRRSSAAEAHLISSSEDDGSRRGSIRRQTDSPNKLVMSSSDEEELSPEMLPKRRPPMKPNNPPRRQSNDSNESLILRRTKKRMILLDSDTDNSLIMDHIKNKKQTCLKDTPLKIESKRTDNKTDVNTSMDYDDVDLTEEETDAETDGESDRITDDESNVKSDDDDLKSETKVRKKIKPSIDSDLENSNLEVSKTNDDQDDDEKDEGVENDESVENDDDDDGPDEDLMVMSRATRMSIMGVIPKDDESDDSDFIQSDDSSRKSADAVPDALDDFPDVTIPGTPEKPKHHKSVESLGEDSDDLPEVTIHETPDRRKVRDDSPDKNKGSEEVPPQTQQKSSDVISDSDDDLPEVTIHQTPKRSALDSSHLTCSPFNSPLHDRTNALNKSEILGQKLQKNDLHKSEILSQKGPKYVDKFGQEVSIDLTINDFDKSEILSHEIPKNSVENSVDLTEPTAQVKKVSTFFDKENAFHDDDVTIIDSKPEIIALSSDDDDDFKIKGDKTSPKPKKSPSLKVRDEPTKRNKDNTMKSYLVPPSYPNQVVYVKKREREYELAKLQRLQEDIKNVRQLLEEMDMESLPDGGAKLIEKLSALEAEARRQGDTVANMVVEPDNPTRVDIAKDGLDAGLSWDDLQKGSNAVQPRMFGKQAMATHMAERNLILDSLRDLHASLASRPAETAVVAAPAALSSELLPHQSHALAWLQWRETQKPKAGILADDMGLGKTITMIALVASDKEANIDHDDDRDDDPATKKMVRGGTLVVCPASLIQQWGNEVSKHCKAHALSVCLHHGAARATQPHRLATYDVVATTYNILQRDSEKNGVLMRVRWRRVILDEAHIVRNHKAVTSRAVCALHTSRRWCLTGTPVQNKDLDLFALLKFLRVSPFDDLAMWKKWIDNKSLGGQERLSTIMRSLLLRRTKIQLQQKGELKCLPDKTQHQRLVTLSKAEMNVYQKVLVLSKSLFAQFLHQRAEKNSGIMTYSKQKDTEYHKMHKKMIALQGVKPVKSHEILVLLLRLRQVCCHCGLIAAMLDDNFTHDAAAGDLLHELDKLSLDDSRRKSGVGEDDNDNPVEESATAAEAIRAVLSPKDPVFQLTKPSAKITAVMECLEENVFVNKDEKAVVVSQWTSVLSLVQKQLDARRIRSVTLSGAVPVPARPMLINAVNDPRSDVRVMLLSLCAGGVGINLCGANHLLLLDPHWNPQLEEQAQDRIYRVGQKKNVNIYKFICVDTVEQSIRKLQEAKLQLAENVLTGARNNAASSLSIEDLKMLFNMGQTAQTDD